LSGQNTKNLVGFRLSFPAVKADDPFKFRLVTVEVGIYVIDDGNPAIRVISLHNSESFSEFGLTVHYRHAPIWKL
jgi:hypothetical protein